MSVAQAMMMTAKEATARDTAANTAAKTAAKPVQPAQTNAKFQQECSTCHIAYAPGLLPAESWRKVMTGLDKHFWFGCLTDQTGEQGNHDFLVSNASNRWNAPTAPLRISETAWFKRKHDSHEISPDVWKNPKVKVRPIVLPAPAGGERRFQ